MRQRWKWISVLIAAVLLGLALWLRQPPIRPAPVPASIVAAAPPKVSPLWATGTSTAALNSPKNSAHFDEIEVCGVGKVKLDSDDWTAAGDYVNALTRNSRRRWLSALRGSDDFRARATGLYLEGFDQDSPRKDSGAARDELVQLAVATKDPAIFALAHAKCLKGTDDAGLEDSCPQLSLDDWTRADADNAVPWLERAVRARQENDGAAEAAAIAHAAQAHRYETYNWSLYSFAHAALPNDMTAADRWILTTQLIGVEAAMRTMPYQPLFQYCSRAQSDATVYRQCNALAELMVNKATTLLESSLGKTLGARIGWPAERVEQLTQELKASMQAINQTTASDPKQQWNCDSVAHGDAYVTRLNELGERGLAKQAIQDSGETIADLSREFDESMPKP